MTSAAHHDNYESYNDDACDGAKQCTKWDRRLRIADSD